MTYFITFGCYGSHLHGEEAGSVDREHNLPGSRLLLQNPKRVALEKRKMRQAPYVLDQKRREVVLQAMLHVSTDRGWTLRAGHVRTNHVHAVVDADVRPEMVMHAFKSYASKFLNQTKIDHAGRKRWVRHGSTRWLWKEENIAAAVRYVVEEQGEPMAVYG